jgi:Polyketide cyclase / dehydrase and lipid transport
MTWSQFHFSFGFSQLKEAEYATMKPSNILAEGTNMRFHHSVRVKASPDRVWAIWMDIRNWPTWDPLITASFSNGPLKLGVEGKVIPKKGLPSKFKIVCFEPASKWALEASLITAKLRVTRSLIAKGDFTTFTHQVEFTGLASSVFARILAPDFRVALPDVMQRLAAQAALPKKA